MIFIILFRHISKIAKNFIKKEFFKNFNSPSVISAVVGVFKKFA